MQVVETEEPQTGAGCSRGKRGRVIFQISSRIITTHEILTNRMDRQRGP